MLVKIEARILIFPGTDFHFTSTAVPPGTFLGSAAVYLLHLCCSGPSMARCRSGPQCCQFSYFVARSSYFCTFPSYKNCLLATFYRQQLATLTVFRSLSCEQMSGRGEVGKGLGRDGCGRRLRSQSSGTHSVRLRRINSTPVPLQTGPFQDHPHFHEENT